MMMKKTLIMPFILGLLVFFAAQTVTAYDPDWRETQKKQFEQMGLAPGDLIDSTNYEKVEGLVPFSVINWLKDGKVRIKIAEMKYDATNDKEWDRVCKLNAGKYTLNEKKDLIEKATGEVPLRVYGHPFPDVDVKNDPDGAMKWMYNRELNFRRIVNYTQDWTIEWIGARGWERYARALWQEYLYWGRDKSVDNPSRHRYRSMSTIQQPYDIAGVGLLTYRKLVATEDEFYIYVPAIRRVKRMSGANRSDPYMGSDMCIDDGFGFCGLINSMKWRFIEEKLFLMGLSHWNADGADQMIPLPDGGWQSKPDEPGPRGGFQLKKEEKAEWQYAMWEGVDIVYAPRIVCLMEAIPYDPYYAYQKSHYWFDKESGLATWKVAWDRSGEYWKTTRLQPVCWQWGEKRAIQTPNNQIYVDDKLDHVTSSRAGGYFDGWRFKTTFDSPKLKPEMFTVERLRMRTK